MVITRRGAAVIVGSLVLALIGRIIGLRELYGVAGLGVGLVIAGLIITRGANPVRVTRKITPSRVHVDQAWRVELVATNAGRRRSPLLGVSTTFSSGQRYARFMLAPLPPNESVSAAFRLPSDKRGVFTLGALVVERSDIFSLVSVKTELAPATKLTVFPRVDDIASLEGSGVTDPLVDANGVRRVGTGGGDFFALTEYEQGDDLRRVHWPSVARTGRLMIRQDETPWRGRTTVVLDLRASVHTPESFEDVLSAAASVLLAGGARNGLVRLVTTGPFDSGFGAGRIFLDHLLEVLALADPQTKPSTGAFAALGAVASDGPVVITTSKGARELGPFMARDTHATGVVFTTSERDAVAPRRGRSMLSVPVGTRGFAAAWRSVATPRRRVGARR